MMDYRFIDQQRDRVQRSLQLRGSDFDLAKIEKLNQERKKVQAQFDEERSKLKTLSAKIGSLFKGKASEKKEAEKLKKESTQLKKSSGDIEVKLSEVESQLNEKLKYLPNVLHESVAEGKGEEVPVVR